VKQIWRSDGAGHCQGGAEEIGRKGGKGETGAYRALDTTMGRKLGQTAGGHSDDQTEPYRVVYCQCLTWTDGESGQGR
jgi:hypothetical protein